MSLDVFCRCFAPGNVASTLGSTVLVLAFIAFIACWIPARRAAPIDPIVALRQ